MFLTKPLFAGLALVSLAHSAQAQIYKCQSPDGRIAYSQTACENSGARAIGEVKINPAPLPAQKSSQPAPRSSGAAGSSAKARPSPPPGVDDPFGDPSRPLRCADMQNQIDGTVAEIRHLEVEQEAQTQHFANLEQRINEYNASPDGRKHPAMSLDNRYADRDREKTTMIGRIGDERIRLAAQLNEVHRLNCKVLGIKLRLAEAERLRAPSLPGPPPR
jgi:Domain of unknown function (DUF4124)